MYSNYPGFVYVNYVRDLARLGLLRLRAQGAVQGAVVGTEYTFLYINNTSRFHNIYIYIYIYIYYCMAVFYLTFTFHQKWQKPKRRQLHNNNILCSYLISKV